MFFCIGQTLLSVRNGKVWRHVTIAKMSQTHLQYHIYSYFGLSVRSSRSTGLTANFLLFPHLMGLLWTRSGVTSDTWWLRTWKGKKYSFQPVCMHVQTHRHTQTVFVPNYTLQASFQSWQHLLLASFLRNLNCVRQQMLTWFGGCLLFITR